MLIAANNLEFEKAALLRDQIKELKRAIDGSVPSAKTSLASYGKNRVASRGHSKAKRR
jgi:excinuclease ABC subunit B